MNDQTDPVIKAVEDGLNEVEQNVTKKQKELENEIQTLKQRQDSFESKAGRLSGSSQKQSPLQKAITKKAEQFQSLQEGTTKDVNLTLKADMLTSNSITGDIPEPSRLAGVKFDPERQFRIRNILPQTGVSTGTISYVDETSWTDGVGMHSEGSDKGQSESDLEEKKADVQTVATYLRFSKRMLDDIGFFANYVSSRATDKVLNKEDQQLLYGTGNSNQLEGLTVAASAWSQTIDAVDNKYDVIINAIAQIDSSDYNADYVLMETSDYWSLANAKASGDGHYLFSPQVRNGRTQAMIGGVPVYPNTAVSSDDFLVGSRQASTLGVREDVNVFFSGEGHTNVIANMITARIEERIVLINHNTNGLIYGDFSTAIAAAS